MSQPTPVVDLLGTSINVGDALHLHSAELDAAAPYVVEACEPVLDPRVPPSAAKLVLVSRVELIVGPGTLPVYVVGQPRQPAEASSPILFPKKES